MRANQLRLTFSAVAGALLTLLRQVGLQGTALARARADTIRARLLKVATRITVTVRRIRVAFPSIYPLQELFAHAHAARRACTVCEVTFLAAVAARTASGLSTACRAHDR